MRLVDVNLLLYATFDVYPMHERGRAWLDACINGDARVGLPWETLTAFVRLASNPRVFSPCLSVGQAWKQAQYWLSFPNVWVPCPTAQHRDILGKLLSRYGVTHKHVADAQLAALAISHGLILSSADDDFSRFTELRHENPLNE